MGLLRRIRDYRREYQQRQEKARREGYRSYGAKRYAKEAPKREAVKRERAARPRPSRRELLEKKAVENYQKQFGTAARISTVQGGMRWLSDAEVREAGSASRQKLRRYAHREPYISAGKIMLNPYWYH